MKDSTILGVSSDYKLYYRESMNDSWIKAPDKGTEIKITGISIAIQGKILGVSIDNSLYFRDSLDAPWVRAANDSGSLKGVAVARDGTILGIGKRILFISPFYSYFMFCPRINLSFHY